MWKIHDFNPLYGLICFQNLFGKEADKLEHANDDERICILLFNVVVWGVYNVFLTACILVPDSVVV